MKRIAFKCVLQTDVVITSNAATEGFHQSLDYIPGAKFLGIVAGTYYKDDESTQKKLDLFHNGTVRFGDAHLMIDDQRSRKMPLPYFFPKGESVEDTIYLDFNLEDGHREKLTDDGIVLKQARTGYFTEGKKYANPKQTFAIKSAYDSEKRRAKDQQMYGYYGLKQGTHWCFYVDFDDKQYVADVIKALEGEHRVGRSRSAEYGLVEISQIKDVALSEQQLKIGRNYIYADSNLCFYNEYLETTGTPTEKDLGLPDGATINWEKSQIRTRIYQTWNRKRFNRDADRLIIEKGSVFAVDVKEGDTIKYPHLVGHHQSEGFGQVLLNPDFLMETGIKLSYSLEKAKVQKSTISLATVENETKDSNDSVLLNYLNRAIDKMSKEDNIDQLVNDFIKKYWNKTYKDGVTSSQWGQVRNYANYANTERELEPLLFSDEIGFFNRGQTENIWRKKGRKKILKDYIFGVEQGNCLPPDIDKIKFVKRLASEMAKKASHQKQNA